MHSNKIMHRDLKPQNIFVDHNMNLKVGDFGISRALEHSNQYCKTSAGTPAYMAP
jgi:NIMA (never in mitosis gene a)-related kinase